MKKVFRGWCSKRAGFKGAMKLFETDCYGEYRTAIFKTKGSKKNWGEYHWPVKKVTITVEVED